MIYKEENPKLLDEECYCVLNAEGARMAHIFYNNKETISLHKKEKLFPLKEGLIRIVNKNLCVYLFDGLRDEDDDECIKNFLLELGMPEKNFY